ncbi:MAG: hypothetical protein KTR31_21345 [Myxococcales bacterium]|nr:hypothetical protein [Myxococcales bacterium]
MSMDALFSYVPGLAGLMLTVAITTTGRPFLTLFLLFGVPEALFTAGMWEVTEWLFPRAPALVLSGLGVASFAEHFLRRTEIYGELVDQVPWDGIPAVTTIWAVFVGTLTFAANAPPELEGALPRWVAFLLLAKALVVFGIVRWARSRALEVVRDLGMGGIVNILETFGVAGVIVAAVLLPPLAVVMVLMAAVPVVIGAIVIRSVETAIDRTRRRPCTICDERVRAEASRCPHCGANLDVVRSLAPRMEALPRAASGQA